MTIKNPTKQNPFTKVIVKVSRHNITRLHQKDYSQIWES